ncbi:hypothetical protein KIN20_020395 [Parelaphostrongylus tenuis]|uniref:Uncharacterized protein n=1 Tax=Parelaphostrongylus tenuis TaxID=148309 RepID=A0AAD5QQU5_PARTN|nr:hypothetical protein KIN20_020395 [Parelaphostrongylus tenuis]
MFDINKAHEFYRLIRLLATSSNLSNTPSCASPRSQEYQVVTMAAVLKKEANGLNVTNPNQVTRSPHVRKLIRN